MTYRFRNLIINKSDLTEALLFLLPFLVGIFFGIPISFILSNHLAISSFMMFVILVFSATIIVCLFHKSLPKIILKRVLNYKSISNLYRLKNLRSISNIHREVIQHFRLNTKLFIRRWIYRCAYCFSLTLGLTYTLMFIITNNVETSYFVAGIIYLLSPGILILTVPLYNVVKDSLDHIDQDIAKTSVTVSDILAIIVFMTAPFYWNFNPLLIVSFTSFILYNILANLLICYIYYKVNHTSLIEWFLEKLETTNTQ